MKTKLIIGFIAIAVISLAGWNRINNQAKMELSNLTLANIEALAQGEVTAECGNMTPVICKATCSRCGKVYETKEAPGPASKVEGKCSCGGTIRGNN